MGAIEIDQTDYCTVLLSGIKDEGPLVAAAGFLTSGCTIEEAGNCGPHAVLPLLYNVRFAAELALHGCTQALEVGRSCTELTNQQSHNLEALFQTWKMNMSHSASKLGWYGGALPEFDPVWDDLELLHQIDVDGTVLRYPTNMPQSVNACHLLDAALNGIQKLVNFTAPLVPKSKPDCPRRLAFLAFVAQFPCDCAPPHELIDCDNYLWPLDSTAAWPDGWP